MQSPYFNKLVPLAALVLTVCALTRAQNLPLEPVHESGSGVTGAFEGWFKNPDGTFSLLFGYFNRNTKQELDIPVGPSNRIDPGGPDQGQPTHFLNGRQWGMFAVRVPADFGKGKLIWTLVANGQELVIPASLHPDYEISPIQELATGNTPPVLRFAENGPPFQGPGGVGLERNATVSTPLDLIVWVQDDAKLTTSSGAPPRNLGAPVTLRWTKFRGPDAVTFSNARPEVEKLTGGTPGVPFSGKATTKVTFGTPGEYILHVVLNDYSGEGGGGFQCCWTTGRVKVTVSR